MTLPPIDFLVDVDNTLPENDTIQQDQKDYLERCLAWPPAGDRDGDDFQEYRIRSPIGHESRSVAKPLMN
jgi:hypothetical protein